MAEITQTDPTPTPIPLYRFVTTIPGVPLLGSWKPLESGGAQRIKAKKASTVIAPVETRLRVATYNTWFDAHLNELRYRQLLRVLGETDPDVVCLQEVTSSFERVLHGMADARSRWLVTQLKDEQAITRSHYGTIFLVRKSLTATGRCTASVSFAPYKGTRCGRGLSLLELVSPQGDVILIGNTHLEYSIEERAAQMQYCVKALSKSSSQVDPALSVLCGDTNIFAYSEIDANFVKAGYIDALVAAKPPQASGGDREIDLFGYLPTFGRSGIKFRDAVSKERVGRLDYILCRSEQNVADGVSRFQVADAGLLGASPIPHEIVHNEGRVDDPDMDVYPSDHLGVYVDIRGF